MVQWYFPPLVFPDLGNKQLKRSSLLGDMISYDRKSFVVEALDKIWLWMLSENLVVSIHLQLVEVISSSLWVV